jgi:hypothetical protein
MQQVGWEQALNGQCGMAFADMLHSSIPAKASTPTWPLFKVYREPAQLIDPQSQELRRYLIRRQPWIAFWEGVKALAISAREAFRRASANFS